jgi:hypothetical protein
MRRITLFGLILGAAVVASGQVNTAAHLNAAALNPVQPMPIPPNMPRYGNILFPGGNPSFPSQLGATIRGTPYGYGPGVIGGGRGPNGGHMGRPATVVVPYAVPMYYGGGYGYDPYGGGYGPQQPTTNVTVVVPQQPAPSVIINQTFTSGEPVSQEFHEISPDTSNESGGLKSYEPRRSTSGSTAPPARTTSSTSTTDRSYVRDDKPTIFLIAMKDTTVQQAIGFWLEGNTLAFVTPRASIQRISMEKVDRDLSVQLNAERNLEFDPQAR